MKEYKAAFTGKREVNIYVRACSHGAAEAKAFFTYHKMFGPCPDEPYMTEVIK